MGLASRPGSAPTGKTPPETPDIVPGSGPERRLVVIGGEHRGRLLARRLAGDHRGNDVDPTTVARAGDYETTHEHGAIHVPDPGTAAALADLDLTPADAALVVTPSDARNLLLVQRLRTTFDLGRIDVVVNDPRNREAFDIDGVRVVCLVSILADAVVVDGAG